MKNVLITGGLGYLGSVVAPTLWNEGYTVKVLDIGFFKDSLLYPEIPVTMIAKDARDFSGDDLAGIDAVVHLAGISNDPFGNLSAEKIYDPTRAYAERIAELCKERGIRFIFASSCSVYGKAEGKILTEESPANPETGYSRNKIEIEQDLEKLADRSFSPIALRFATAFGISPRMRFDIVINMLCGMAVAEEKIILNSDGQAWRPNVHIEDISLSIAAALRSNYAEGKLLIVNVGREDNNMKIIDIAHIVAEESGGVPVTFLKSDGEQELFGTKLVKAGARDTRNYRVSFEKIKKVFPEFYCTYSIRDGVRDMVKKFKALKLDGKIFKDPKFYRLQTIERLLKEGQINDDLRWVAKEDDDPVRGRDRIR